MDTTGDRVFPRGMVRAALLASACAGPIGVSVMALMVSAETLLARLCDVCAQATGASPDMMLPSPFDLVFIPIATAPLSMLATVLTAFLPTLALIAGIFLVFPDAPWLARRGVWGAIGFAAGSALGIVAFGIMGPMRDADVWQASGIGAVTGSICAAIARRALARRGVFARPPRARR